MFNRGKFDSERVGPVSPEELNEGEKAKLAKSEEDFIQSISPYSGKFAAAWEGERVMNFYGRFLPDAETVPLDEKKYVPALVAFIKRMSADPEAKPAPQYYFDFLSGRIDPNLKPETAHDISPSEVYAAASVAFARILNLRLASRTAEAETELEQFKKFIVALPKESFHGSFLDNVEVTMQRLYDNFSQEKVRKATTRSMDKFLFTDPGSHVRTMPDFRDLLRERIMWYMANDLAEDIALLNRGKGAPSFDRFYAIADQYENNIDLYKNVENEDVPVYWAAEKNLESHKGHIVVFGRDGRYLFTALKTARWDNGPKPTYVILSGGLKSTWLKPQDERNKEIVTYLRENGIVLDSLFVDTGYQGSIPEFAIRLLAKDEGKKLWWRSIDKKIRLLSSSTRRRKAIGRESNDRDAVARIEGRSKSFESPDHFVIDAHGKTVPALKPQPVSEQLRAWVTEHAVLRNFLIGFNEVHAPIEMEMRPEDYEKLRDTNLRFQLLQEGILPVEEKDGALDLGRDADKSERFEKRRAAFESFAARHLADVSEEKRQEILRDAVRLYEVSRDIVGPVMKDFVTQILKTATPNEALLFLARDGFCPWLMAKTMVRDGEFPGIEENDLKYAHISRNTAHSDLLHEYFMQLGIGEKTVIHMVDVGMYGSIHEVISDMYPKTSVRSSYLVSHSENSEIPGYLFDIKRDKRTGSIWNTIVGNKAVHFIEDTFSGFFSSSKRLVKDGKGKIRPELGKPYSREIYLKRLAAMMGAIDCAKLPSEGSEAAHKKALNDYLAGKFNEDAEHIMVPHE